MSIPGQPYPQPYSHQPPLAPVRSGWSNAALVLGILALFGSFAQASGMAIFLGLAAIACAVVGLVRHSRGVAAGRGLAIWGLILGLLAALAGIGRSSGSEAARPSSASTTSTTTANAAPARATQQPAASLPPGAIPGDGTFLVGTEVQPGTYRSTGAKEGFFEFCSWTRLRDTTGNSGSTIAFGTANANEPMIVTIQPSDAAFKTSGCEPFVKIK